MKVKLLLVVALALGLIIAIGCSNGSRTTAPPSNDSFSLSSASDAGAVRFENEDPIPVEQNYNPRQVTIYGKFFKESTGCLVVETAWKEYTELLFPSGPPANINEGDYIQVRGTYVRVPGTICSYDKQIMVIQVKIVDPGN